MMLGMRQLGHDTPHTIMIHDLMGAAAPSITITATHHAVLEFCTATASA